MSKRKKNTAKGGKASRFKVTDYEEDYLYTRTVPMEVDSQTHPTFSVDFDEYKRKLISDSLLSKRCSIDQRIRELQDKATKAVKPRPPQRKRDAKYDEIMQDIEREIKDPEPPAPPPPPKEIVVKPSELGKCS